MKKPHLDKILAAIDNPLSKNDKEVLGEIHKTYEQWVEEMDGLHSLGTERVVDMVTLLDEYKNHVEIDLIMDKGSEFLKRQKGQLKLDNSIIEEFLVRLVNEKTFPELKGLDFVSGPEKAFMSLSFLPKDVEDLAKKPTLAIKTKDQDFTLGKEIYYKFSTKKDFAGDNTLEGKLTLAILAAECKANLDKTMFQEAAGTAARLKQGVPYSKYFVLVEFLDMQPEDTRLTDIDNVFLLRKCKRLPFEKRRNIEMLKKQRQDYPISSDVVLKFLDEIRGFLSTKWYDPNKALERGSFI